MSDSRGMHEVDFSTLDVQICEDAIVQVWMSGSGNRSEASDGGLLMHPGPRLSTTQGFDLLARRFSISILVLEKH